MATPMAGTCEVAMPATILAMGGLRRGPVLVAVALHTATARQHHLRVGLLGHAGHHAGHILEGQPVAEGDLDGVVDISSDLQHSQPIAFRRCAALSAKRSRYLASFSLKLLRFSALLSDMQNMFNT